LAVALAPFTYDPDQLEANADQDALRLILAASPTVAMTCGTCSHFLPWDRITMSGQGDCHAPGLRGRLNGMAADFGCTRHTPKEE
jgi:hypothetical protein